jgi:nucleoid-associated protein YgaU
MPTGAEQTQVALQNQAQPQTNNVSPAANPAQTDPRFQMALPQGSAAPAPTPGTMTVQPVQTQDSANMQPVPAINNPVSKPAQTAPSVKPQTAKSAGPQTYVVQDGDSLSSIAKKVYGDQAGSKLVNVNGIFHANQKILASPDDLQVGQKLTIPALTASTPAPAVLSGQTFTKVESVGQRHPTPTDKPAAAPKTDASKQGKIYVVKEGDSLWRVASDNLGDGNRYKEIVKLNNLTSEDDIQVGMQLKLPAK